MFLFHVVVYLCDVTVSCVNVVCKMVRCSSQYLVFLFSIFSFPLLIKKRKKERRRRKKEKTRRL